MYVSFSSIGVCSFRLVPSSSLTYGFAFTALTPSVKHRATPKGPQNELIPAKARNAVSSPKKIDAAKILATDAKYDKLRQDFLKLSHELSKLRESHVKLEKSVSKLVSRSCMTSQEFSDVKNLLASLIAADSSKHVCSEQILEILVDAIGLDRVTYAEMKVCLNFLRGHLSTLQVDGLQTFLAREYV